MTQSTEQAPSQQGEHSLQVQAPQSKHALVPRRIVAHVVMDDVAGILQLGIPQACIWAFSVNACQLCLAHFRSFRKVRPCSI